MPFSDAAEISMNDIYASEATPLSRPQSGPAVSKIDSLECTATVMSFYFDKKEGLGLAIYNGNENKLSVCAREEYNSALSLENLSFRLSHIMGEFHVDHILCTTVNLREVRKKIPEVEKRRFQPLPGVFFEVATGFRHISAIKVREQGETDQDNGCTRYMKLSNLLEQSSVNLIRSIGALSLFISRCGYPFVKFEFFQGSHVLLSSDTLSALDILKPDPHPNLLLSSGSKQGFSLFSLLHRCISPGGLHKLKEYLKSPLCDAEQINQRLNMVEFFLNRNAALEEEMVEISTGNMSILKYFNVDISSELSQLRRNLKCVKDVELILKRVNECRPCLKDWVVLYQSLVGMFGVLDVADALHRMLKDKGLIENFKLLKDTVSCKTKEILLMFEKLDMVDWEISVEKDRLVPKKNINSTLDEYRELYDKMDEVFIEIKEKLNSKYGYMISSRISPTYFQTLGFLLCVEQVQTEPYVGNKKRKHGVNQFDEQFLAPIDFDFQFEQFGDANKNEKRLIYYRSPLTKQLDKSCGDIFGLILSLEQKIWLEMEERVRMNIPGLLKLLDCVSVLDVLQSFAESARDLNYCRPNIIQHNNEQPSSSKNFELKAIGLRHPLLEVAIDDGTYIANDVVVTPGKSALLKAVGLLAVMTQVGSFVAASEASMTIFNRVFTRIETKESTFSAHSNWLIGKKLESSFGLDIGAVNHMLRFGEGRSLCLIDEFGKGTTTEDGASLLISSLDALCSTHRIRGLTFCATHFYGYFKHGFFQAPESTVLFVISIGIIHCRMKVAFEPKIDDQIQTAPISLYKIEDGIAGGY
eukprot:augustus_masked-scaffold_1-processed-gene-28.41-mRNA-1 protein AED:0.46 eAED:0.46 QI:0/0/0/0.5/1/1/2/0/810